jgi:hypothetical protein
MIDAAGCPQLAVRGCRFFSFSLYAQQQRLWWFLFRFQCFLEQAMCPQGMPWELGTFSEERPEEIDV